MEALDRLIRVPVWVRIAAVYAAIALGAAGLAAMCSGCGAGAVRTHATAALYTTHAVRVGGEAVDAARASALDDLHEPDAIREEAARWEPIGAALDAVRETLAAWVDGIDLARIADDEGIGLAALLPLAARVLALYARAAALASSLDAELPALPPWLLAVAGGAL